MLQVGVVSDYDLLAIDTISGTVELISLLIFKLLTALNPNIRIIILTYYDSTKPTCLLRTLNHVGGKYWLPHQAGLKVASLLFLRWLVIGSN